MGYGLLNPDASDPIDMLDPVDIFEPLNTGLVARYLALPGLIGGRRFVDLTNPGPGGNHGTLTNMDPATAWQATNRPGGRGQLDFTSATSNVNAGNPSVFTNLGPLTWMCWVSPVYNIVGGVDAFNKTEITFRVDETATNWRLEFFVDGTGGDVIVDSDVDLDGDLYANGSMVHVAVTWTGVMSAGQCRMYHNGFPVGLASDSGSGTQKNDAAFDLVLGGGNANGGAKFDDFRVYDRVLPPSEIHSVWQDDLRGNPRTTRRVPRRRVGVSISAAITGTATATIDESDVVAGGKTIIITLTGDTWVAAGATFNAQRQNIIDGLDSAQVEGTGWNAEVRDKEVVTAVVRTSDTVVTITLTAAAAYDITAQETITVTVPASALVTSASEVIGSPTFTVDEVAVGSANLFRGKLRGGMLLGGKL